MDNWELIQIKYDATKNEIGPAPRDNARALFSSQYDTDHNNVTDTAELFDGGE